jgi:subtilisin family serine protease
MRPKAILGAGTAAVTMILGLVVANQATATPLPASAAGPARSAPVRTVTLITGDRLTVTDTKPERVAVRPGPGRAGIRFLTRNVHGHLQVLPSDALPLVNAGRLDPRLFDVTTLLASGYDDRRADLPLIVTYQAGTPNRAGALRATPGAAGARDLPAVGGVAVKERRHDAGAFWKSIVGTQAKAQTLTGRISKVWLDGLRKPTLDVSVPLIGAPQAWQAGFTGAGVTVAVVDTGIDSSHPDLSGRVQAAQNFTEDGDTLDHVGHGTHVASTIAGSGAASGGRYKGVAPDAKLLSAKVCQLEGCAESWILAGMQWAAADQHAKVVNMSLGGPDGPEIDPIEQAVQSLTGQYGTLFVVAAGNAGQGGDHTVSSPASADDALAVAAVTKTEQLADFSSRGPRVGDDALKPDISAPGVGITAARGKDGIFGKPGDQYTTLSGTSMATPHVAGSAAILAQVHPDWTPAQLKAGLMASAKPNPAIGAFAQGAGRVDIGRGIHQTVTTTPASLSYGRQEWPHNDDKPVAKTVSYHNYGSSAVTLTLALHTTGPDGKPSAAGAFTLSATTLAVPAGGDATVTVTSDTRVAGPDGFLGGELTATAGDLTVQTPIAVVKEVESYDVTLTHLDRAGQPATQYGTALFDLDKGAFFDAFDQSGTAKVRVPKGRYLVTTVIFSGDPANADLIMLTQPVLDVSRAQTLTLDARQGKLSSVTVPRAGATQLVANIGFVQQTSTSGFGSLLVGSDFTHMYTAQLGPNSRVKGLVSNISGQWGQVASDGSSLNSPYAYLLSWFESGRIISGFHRDVADRDLATVRVDMALEATGATGEKVAFSSPTDGMGDGGFAAGFQYDLPGSRTEYFNSDGGAQWEGLFLQEVPSTDPNFPFPVLISDLISSPTVYRAGHSYHETWNQGVFGPVFPERRFPDQWVTRTGDAMLISPPLYGDNAGRGGFSATDTAKITVLRDGTKVFEADQPGAFIEGLPAATGRYRIEIGTTRVAPFNLSTRTNVAWTFRSGHVTGDQPAALPLSAIQFLPQLDLHNTASGAACVIPLTVTRQPGSPAGHNESLTVKVSFDDGATWTKAFVIRLGNGGLAFANCPSGHGYVSLQASAADSKGNTVDETIIRAYRF